MSPTSNVHFLAKRKKRSPKSKIPSLVKRSEQNAIRVGKKSVASLANFHEKLSHYIPPFQGYNLDPHTDPIQQMHDHGGEVFQPLIMPVVTIHNLHLERTYLLSSLKKDDRRATDMLKQIHLVQQYLDLPFDDTNSYRNEKNIESESLKKTNSSPEFLTQPFPQVHKGKLTRQLNHLKNRLIEMNKQEMCMLARLEQVTGKILNQQKWQASEKIWGFPDTINLHSYRWKLDGVEGIDGLDGVHLVANVMAMKGSSGFETSRSGVSPGTQTPVESAVPTSTKKRFDPRSPSFIPRMPLPTRCRHSLIEWAEPQYSHIMDEVKNQQAQPRNDGDLQPPLNSPPTRACHCSSLIDWAEPRYEYIFEEVRQAQEQRAHKMEVQSVRGLERVQIHEAPERLSMHVSIIELDGQVVSSGSVSSRPFFTSNSTETATTGSSVEAQISVPCPNELPANGEEQSHTGKGLLHENYQLGLAKIRAASVTYSPTFQDSEESAGNDEEDEKRYATPITRYSWPARTPRLRR